MARIVYLTAVMLINVFKRSELEKWLRQSTWGLANEHWKPLDEILRLEQSIHHPQAKLSFIAAGPE